MEIRTANIEDVNEILMLTNMVADMHGYARQDILRKKPRHINRKKLLLMINSENHIQLVAEINKKIVGVMLCSIKYYKNDPKYKNCKYLSIEDTCVKPKYRRMKIGSLFIEYIKKLANKLNCSFIQTNVWSFNKESKNFFENNGFIIKSYLMELKSE